VRVPRLDRARDPRQGKQRLTEQKDRLVLVAHDYNIIKVFEVTGLDRMFTIVPTRASALNGASRA
jgi:hypothetical protein